MPNASWPADSNKDATNSNRAATAPPRQPPNARLSSTEDDAAARIRSWSLNDSGSAWNIAGHHLVGISLAST
jgi:hypothetical protein